MNANLRHKFKMLKKLRDRNASPARILRAMKAFEKEKESVQTDHDSAEENDTAEHYEEGGRAIF